MNIELLMTLAIIHSVALASPGPDFALVVKMASQESRKTAIASAAGISVAILGHTILSLTGISLVIKSAEGLFFFVQLAGASYLAWMGINAVKSALHHWQDKPSAQTLLNQNITMTTYQGFLQGLYTNLLNPKAMVFFITLFSTMITPDVGLVTKVLAAIMLLVLSLVWFVFIALVLSKPNIQQRVQKAAPMINLFTGVLFISVSAVIVAGLF